MTRAAQQRWDPDQYSANARFVSELGMPVVELLAPRPGERVLDLGCGDGTLTRRLLELGCQVVGVDASPAMVEAACALGIDARVMDGAEIDFDCEFDAVFSNAALHWIGRPERVVSRVWSALRPGGRFVGEFGGAGNTEIVVAALEEALRRRSLEFAALNPWYFPDEREYRERLEEAGFRVSSIARFPRVTPQPGSLVRWLETFAQVFTAALPVQERAPLLQEVEDACRASLRDAAGRWSVDYVRLRFSAIKPAS